MARLNDDGQWIVLMGFLISLAFFFLAILLNQSVVVGQTTAEGVLEFPKNDIRDFHNEVVRVSQANVGNFTDPRSQGILADFQNLSMNRKGAVTSFNTSSAQPGFYTAKTYRINLHYSNGVSVYNETAYY